MSRKRKPKPKPTGTILIVGVDDLGMVSTLEHQVIGALSRRRLGDVQRRLRELAACEQAKRRMGVEEVLP